MKLIATDMDGTFLKSDQTYDTYLFDKSFNLMEEKDIKFVVASGNQLENLISRFPDHYQDIYFIAENGGVISHGEKILKTNAFSSTELCSVKEILSTIPYPSVLEGLNSAYIRHEAGNEFIDEMKKYYSKIKLVDNFNNISDVVLKTAIVLPEEQNYPTIQKLKKRYPTLEIVSGAKRCIEIQPQNVDKATGLEYLGNKLNISPKEMISFGDSGNDVKMLQMSGRSFVTKFAMTIAKDVATEIIGSSDESAVQNKILQLLK